jgi:predicted glycoside hydrolase/deacetylase ChbG (UPF0249 family)
MKSLIINADDVGLSDSINKAVERCYSSGVITGTSVIGCGRRVREAAGMLRDLGKTEVGAHLTLTGQFEPCTKDASNIKTLLFGKGVFHGDYGRFMRLCSAGKIDIGQVYIELASQIKRIKGEGLEITHLDSHEHVHMFPEVLEVVMTLAEEFKIPYIRLPLEDPVVIKKQFKVRDLLRYGGLRMFALRAKKKLFRKNFDADGNFLGHFHSGRIDDDILFFMITHLREGVSELAVHPGVMSPELLEESPWHRNAQREMDALINGRWKTFADSEGVRLVTHKEAVRSIV